MVKMKEILKIVERRTHEENDKMKLKKHRIHFEIDGNAFKMIHINPFGIESVISPQLNKEFSHANIRFVGSSFEYDIEDDKNEVISGILSDIVDDPNTFKRYPIKCYGDEYEVHGETILAMILEEFTSILLQQHILPHQIEVTTSTGVIEVAERMKYAMIGYVSGAMFHQERMNVKLSIEERQEEIMLLRKLYFKMCGIDDEKYCDVLPKENVPFRIGYGLSCLVE